MGLEDRTDTGKDEMKGISKDMKLYGQKERSRVWNRQVWLYWWVYEGEIRELSIHEVKTLLIDAVTEKDYSYKKVRRIF